MIIYRYTNKVNNKVYIGQTGQTLKQRHSVHICSVKGNHDDFAIHRAMRKYGIDNFLLEQIDSASTQPELNEKEIYWIKHHQSFGTDKGYNMTPGGQGEQMMTEEIRQKIGKTQKEKWNRLTDVERSIKMKKERKCFTMSGRTQSDHQKQIVREVNQKEWIVTDPTGISQKITNLRQFCLSHNLDPSNMMNVAKGSLNHHKRWKCTKVVSE